ncbi:MAG: hypothetical protein L0H96_01885 [Humibacillus sp.]|nr:hypothetical protein [Humibacillus sp.]MDN5775644.1 hypothetical protein [Humibacillus sp.]
MEILEKIFGGWWGSISAGAVVVLLEYFVVKPLVERSGRRKSKGGASPRPSKAERGGGNFESKIKQGKKSKAKLKVNQSRTVIINHIHASVTPPTDRSGDNKNATTSKTDSDNDSLVAWIIGSLVLFLFSAWLVARYSNIIVNVMLGTAAGTLVTSALLTIRFRNSPVPLRRWLTLNLIATVFMIFGVVLLRDASYKGVDLQDMAATVRELSFFDALPALQKQYDVLILLYFGSLTFGAIALVMVSMIIMGRVLGIVVAAASLSTPNPQPWHAKIVALLYPSGSLKAQFIALIVVSLIGLLLISGWAVSKPQELFKRGFPVPASSTIPSTPRATTSK